MNGRVRSDPKQCSVQYWEWIMKTDTQTQIARLEPVTPAEALRQQVGTIAHIDAANTTAIQNAFDKKIPFVITNAGQNPNGINMAFLEENLGDVEVTCFNPESNSEHIQLDTLLDRIKRGEKYRLRADAVLGDRLAQYFNVGYFDKIRRYAKTLMDIILHVFAQKKWAIFLSTPTCKMSNHAHINSTFVIQLEGRKTWHLDFLGMPLIEHKDLYPYDFLAEKHPDRELELTLEPGQILYLPAYWFHYTDTDDVTLSMHYLFAEPMRYYFRPAIRPLFLYELFKRPIGMMKLALARNNELGFGDKKKWQKTKTKAQLAFLKQNDYS